MLLPCESPAVDHQFMDGDSMKKQSCKYQWILDTYPETITKEQLYKLCHVSKKTAQHYLVNGIIPCMNTGKKTRQYTIRTVDVVKFLELRDRDPDICLAPIGWYRQNATVYRPRIHSPVTIYLSLLSKESPCDSNYRKLIPINGNTVFSIRL